MASSRLIGDRHGRVATFDFCCCSGLLKVLIGKVVEARATHKNLRGSFPRRMVQQIVGDIRKVGVKMRVVR